METYKDLEQTMEIDTEIGKMKLEGWYKSEKGENVLWAYPIGCRGVDIFTFDKKTIYYMWEDYPHTLTPEQKAIFDRENPYWADFFKGR